MCTRQLLNFTRKYTKNRYFHTTLRNYKEREFENPIFRTIRILSNDVVQLTERIKNLGSNQNGGVMKECPSHADIVIIGGAAMGSSIAYWLQEKTNRDDLKIVVIEKDMTFSKCSTVLSVGGLRQQFSLPENIHLSLYGAEFLRTLKKRFGPDADVCFTPHGYLLLATEENAQTLMDNSQLQRELGAVNTILNKGQLKKRFPWINVDDVELGCLGLEKEGWFDPWSLLFLLKTAAAAKGTYYLNGEVVDFLFQRKNDMVVQGVEVGTYEGLNEVVVKLPNGDHKIINFAYCVLAAGSESGEIAKLARIGNGSGLLSIPLPVEKRKRYVYQFDCQGEPPGINTPLTIDHTGAYFRRDGLGGSFIGGRSPTAEEEPDTNDLEVDHNYFDEKVWPALANRVPAFNAVKVRSAWSGFYEYNSFDENGIIGPHPYYTNFYIATGFSGHGIQQAPAVGRAISELILDGNFQTIDLTRFGFNRLIQQIPLLEAGIF